MMYQNACNFTMLRFRLWQTLSSIKNCLVRLLTTWLPIHQRPTIKRRPYDRDVTAYKQNHCLKRRTKNSEEKPYLSMPLNRNSDV